MILTFSSVNDRWQKILRRHIVTTLPSFGETRQCRRRFVTQAVEFSNLRRKLYVSRREIYKLRRKTYILRRKIKNSALKIEFLAVEGRKSCLSERIIAKRIGGCSPK